MLAQLELTALSSYSSRRRGVSNATMASDNGDEDWRDDEPFRETGLSARPAGPWSLATITSFFSTPSPATPRKVSRTSILEASSPTTPIQSPTSPGSLVSSSNGQQNSAPSSSPQRLHERIVNSVLRDTPVNLPLRLRAKIKLQNSTLGQTWDTWQVFLSFLACVLYVLSTYSPNYPTQRDSIIEYTLTGFFASDLVRPSLPPPPPFHFPCRCPCLSLIPSVSSPNPQGPCGVDR